jgi:hypothetical protein
MLKINLEGTPLLTVSREARKLGHSGFWLTNKITTYDKRIYHESLHDHSWSRTKEVIQERWPEYSHQRLVAIKRWLGAEWKYVLETRTRVSLAEK